MTGTELSPTAALSVNMPTVEMDTAMKGLRSVMEKTLDTRHVTHIFQGHTVTSSAPHTASSTPQTANTSLEEQSGLRSRILCVSFA